MPMNEEKISRIKVAVMNNFDKSPEQYQAFENEHGFFCALNGLLLSRMKLPVGSRVLDVGCGTGVSTLQIADVVPESRVWGLDISSAMLDQARINAGDSDRLTFVHGDAGRLADHFSIEFDAVIYSASIFLIPDYEESLKQARRLLSPTGKVGVTFMDGLYDEAGNNLVAEADRMAGEGVSLSRAVKLREFRATFEKLFPRSEEWTEDFRLALPVIRQFFSVPAMSAGLFPRIVYEERLKKVERLFAHLPGDVLFRWVLMAGSSLPG